MILLIGLLILAVAVALGALGVATNMGVSHALTGDFAILGQHVKGLSTGQLFLFGIIVGLVAALGLAVLRGLFTRGLERRDLRKELQRSHAENERIRKELAVERSLNISHQSQAHISTPGSEETPTI